MKNKAKVIFHIDLNQFFCSVVIIKNPRLKGKAFAIGRENSTKGVISTASYEARKYGIHAGMPQIEAISKLPSLIIVDYGYEIYSHYSNLFFKLIKSYVKDVEQTSIDEGYIDVTSITIDINRHPLDLAKEIQTRALKELNLPCSIGIAPTLYLAKMASDLKKPLGITILRIRDIEEMLYDLDVKEIFGIGKKTYPILHQFNINTIRDFMDINNETTVRKIVGSQYDYFISALSGKTTNIVDPNRYSEPESISKSTTFDSPLATYDDVLNNLFILADDVFIQLKAAKKKTKTITITLRDTSFNTITRSKTIPDYTADKTLLKYYVEDLLDENYQNIPLRLVGVGFSHLVDLNKITEEVTLFNYQSIYEKEEALRNLMSDFDKRFGKNSLFFGKELKED